MITETNNKPYKRLTEDIYLYEWTLRDEKEYNKFCEYVWKSNGGELLVEFSYGKELVDKIKFIKDFAQKTGYKLKDLLTLFMEKAVFKLFQLLGWDIKSFFRTLEEGFKIQKNLNKAIEDFTNYDENYEWNKNDIIHFSNYIKSHPKTKRVSKSNAQGYIIYLIFTLMYYQLIPKNIDISIMFKAYSSLGDFFITRSGYRLVIIFLTKNVPTATFVWGAYSIKDFSVKIFDMLGNYFGKNITKGYDPYEKIEVV